MEEESIDMNNEKFLKMTEDNFRQDTSNVENESIHQISSQHRNTPHNQDQDDNLSHSVSQTEPKLQIKSTLLKQEDKKQIGNRIIEENPFDKAGSNGVFDVDPKVVKFAGFIKNTSGDKNPNVYTQKVKVINKSKFSQRLSIIPPTTPYFKIRFSRRGLIPQGLAEIIFVQFTPLGYQYYYDYIRILCEGDDKLTIPIHAFPLMDMNISPKYIPRYIDFKTVFIDTTNTKELCLVNQIDSVAFEYELVPVKVCNEIKIEPLLGDIHPEDSLNILISFTPHSYGIFTSEYEFRLSEFDFLPQKLYISGICKIYDPSEIRKDEIETKTKASKNIDGQRKRSNFKAGIANNQAEQSYTNKKISVNEEEHKASDDMAFRLIERNQSIKEKDHTEENQDDISDKNLKEDLLQSRSYSARHTSESKSLAKYKFFPSTKEREFLKYYNSTEKHIQEKEIKYLRFLGKKEPNDEEKQMIQEERSQEKNYWEEVSRRADLQTFSIERDSKKSCAEKDKEFLLKPLFNYNNNDSFFKTRKLFNVFLKNISKVVIQNRAEKRLNKLKNMLRSNNIQSREDFNNYVKDDWFKYFTNDENKAAGANHRIKFNCNVANFTRPKMFFSNEISIDKLKQEIPHEININFDEIEPYEKFERWDQEILQYREFKTPGLTQVEFSIDDKVLRKGAENENLIDIGEFGDSEISYDVVSKILDCRNHMDMFTRNIHTDRETVIFKNPNTRQYFNFNDYTEASLDYNLQPQEFSTNDISMISQSKTYAYDLLDKVEFSHYRSLDRREITSENLIYEDTLNFLPRKIDQPDPKDLFIKSKEKVDEDNFIFKLDKDHEEKIVEQYEIGDEVIKSIRELNKDDIFHNGYIQSNLTDKRLNSQKRTWAATLPTFVEYYNSGIVNPENKIIH